ncbi:hypothetical protein BC938DRAFT_471693 [Jimgerdemannia flammicorona]|uniref:Fucosyltransferase n=1 Tax=Jimgerdemannia flammicorona TaxID=994334 RepID=A0A433QUL2_9FUNG|nr:hypothetical protein BC938DRAFT_471693 [Jimgerdemannia flammicorona]
MHLSKLPTGPHRRLLATLLAFVLFANIVFILYPTSPTSSAAPAVKPEAPAVKPEAPAVKLIGNNPFQAEYDNNDPQSCNGLHPILRADLNETIPRHYALKGPKTRVVTIFLWRQQTYAMSNISWPELAKDLCPYPPELVAYFKAYWDRHVNDDYPRWPNGWAPCWLWKINSESDNLLNYGRESVAYYPYVRMESFLRNFDFTIGAPASLYDLSHPLEPITSKRLKLMIAAPPPTIRSDGIQLAWMVSNCSPRNQRNEVMKGLMEEMEVHSFGRCMHNMDFPEEIKLKFKLTEEVSNNQYWGPWQDIKREIFAGYPYVVSV